MVQFFISNNGEITDSNLSLVTRVNFNHYKINSTLPPSPIARTPGPTRSPSMALSGMSDSQISLNNFKKGTKRDLSAYPIFKSEEYYDTFHCSFYPTTKAQDMGTLSTPSFTPSTVTHLLNYFLMSNNHSCTPFWL